MRITRVETIPVSYQSTERFFSAMRKLGPLAKANAVVIKVHTDEEIMGIGEAVTKSSFFGQPLEAVKFAVDKYLAPRIIGKDPFDLEQISVIMDKALFGNSCAKCGVEIALYDVIGKKLNLPVHKIIGGCYREKVLAAVEVGTDTPKECVRIVQELVQKGIRVFKIKVGFDPQVDVEKVRATREAVGHDIILRADMNEGWSPEKAIKFIKKLERYELELVEQPVPRWNLDGLALVKRAVDVPIEADESAFSPHDVIELIKRQAVDIINVKIGKASFSELRKNIAIAEAAGIPCLIGTALEYGSATAAKLHLASSNKNVEYACEFTELYLFKDSILREDLRIEDGYVRVPMNAGLGVTLDEDKLKPFSKLEMTSGYFDEY